MREIVIKLSDYDYRTIKEIADSAGLSVADYLKKHIEAGIEQSQSGEMAVRMRANKGKGKLS